jgi:hypothetical protein
MTCFVLIKNIPGTFTSYSLKNKLQIVSIHSLYETCVNVIHLLIFKTSFPSHSISDVLIGRSHNTFNEKKNSFFRTLLDE